MSAVNGKKIVVVGGGPGGLTLARLLQLQGADVSVYERDTDRFARVQGSALDLHADSGLAALEAAGLMDGFWKHHRPELNRLRLVDQDADVLYDFMRGTADGVHRPEIERGPLRDLLLDSLEPGTVHWNCKLESTAADGESLRLTFAGGDSVVADLAVGADGANSRLRAMVTPVRPAYAGVSLIEGYVPSAESAVPELCALLGGSALLAMGAEKTLAMATKSDGGILFYAGLRNPDAHTRETLDAAADAKERAAWFHGNYAEWSGVWAQLFERATSLVWRALQVCPPDQRWDASRNVTLIGDAAHVMPPYAGEGVNMAMLDALVLSRELASQVDARSAIEAYEAEMFTRAARVTEETMHNTEMFYAPDASDRIVGMFQHFAASAAANS